MTNKTKVSKYLTIQESWDLGVQYLNDYSECLPTYRGAGIYIIEFSNGVKIGYSRNICQRVKTYQYPWCRHFIAIKCYKSRNPKQLEQYLLSYYYKQNKHTIKNTVEFFPALTLQRITEFLEKSKYFRRTGAYVNSTLK